MRPTTRQEFKDNVMRRLGWPAVAVEVTEEQLDDRVDEALLYYADYHFDGTEKMYYKYAIQEGDRPDRLNSIAVYDGGTGYSNSDTVTITANNNGTNAEASIITNASGVITSFNIANNGSGYDIAPTVTISSGSGSGASIEPILGGFIPVPENIIGIIRMFSIADAIASSNFFSIRYQIALNDLYQLTSVSMVPYFQAFQHIRLIEELLIGKQPIRYNRHRDRLHVDMDWTRIENGELLLFEAYQIVDPVKFPDVWGDRWLQRYCAALVKRNWAEFLTKYNGMMMAGQTQFSGQQKMEEALAEIAKLEDEMIYTYSLPNADFIGALTAIAAGLGVSLPTLLAQYQSFLTLIS